MVISNQIKWNMPANILPSHTPEVGSKGQKFFLVEVVKLHNKLKGIKCRTACKQMLGPYSHPGPLGGVKTFFLNGVEEHIK